MRRLMTFIGAIILTATGGAVVAPSATAAVPSVTIYNRRTGACLEQEFSGGSATINVYLNTYPCTGHNAHWRFEFVGNNQYRVVNDLWDGAGLWCLSAPNGYGTRIYAELCVNPLPPKQRWTPMSALDTRYNILMNAATGGCLWQNDVDFYRHIPVNDGCPPYLGVNEWYWF